MSESSRTTWGKEYTRPVGLLRANEIAADELLFLALHVRDELIKRIAQVKSEEEVAGWVNLIAAGFANLLANSDIDDLHRLYHLQNDWVEKVRPPSVIAGELMIFLGALSAINPAVYDGCKKRGSIQAYLRLLPSVQTWFETGVEKYS